MSKRPEHTAPPEIFYDDSEAKKYTANSRIATIQTQLSERALELLALPDDGVPRLLLDVGCGSCLSGDAISEAGHTWVVRCLKQHCTQPQCMAAMPNEYQAPSPHPQQLSGLWLPAVLDANASDDATPCCSTTQLHAAVSSRNMSSKGDCITAEGASVEGIFTSLHTQGMDISKAMLEVAEERGVDGDACLADMGQGLPLRGGCFDGAISISAVQWLCNADTATADPRKRLRRFFESLYGCLARGARAVLQMYPENAKQAEMLTSAAMRAGFTGGLVVDFPNSAKAKKYFLVLMVGQPAEPMDLQGLDGEEAPSGVAVVGRRKDGGKHGRKGRKGSIGHTGLSARHPESKGKAWIHRKKDAMRAKGYLNVPLDSKYTGRKRKSKF